MSAPPGGLVGPKVWLVPRYSQPAGTLIKLGSILTNPYNPETSLNLQENLNPIDIQIRDASHSVRIAITSTSTENTSTKIGGNVPISHIINMRLSLSGSTKQDITTTLKATNITAKYFLPDDAYCRSIFEKPDVVKHVRFGGFPPLYLIIGVATASQLNVTENIQQDHTTEFTIANSAEARPSISHNQNLSSTIESSIAGVDFAYRVRELVCYRFLHRITQRDVIEGTLMSGGVEESNNRLDDSGEPDIPIFAYLDTEDTPVDKKKNVADENGRKVESFLIDQSTEAFSDERFEAAMRAQST